MDSRTAKLAELVGRFKEVDDVQLGEIGELLTLELSSAADERDLDKARAISELHGRTKTEITRRKRVKAETEHELRQLLTRAGLADPPEPEPEPEPAGAILAAAKPTIADLQRHRSRHLRSSPRPPAETSRWTTPAGRELGTVAEIADELRSRLLSLGREGRFSIARASWELPPERRLGRDFTANRSALDAVVSPPALVASGGICAPPNTRYDFPSSSTGSRPLRDGLPRFDADRGGIVYLPTPRLVDVGSAVGITTEAQDASGENYPKPCLQVTCDEPTELHVQAVHRCLQFSNFNARTHPEAVEHYIDLTISAVARAAEDSLWTRMLTASTAVTAGENLSATRDVLAAVGRAAAQLRSRHRMPQDFTMRWAAPAWLIDLMQADMGRQAPGDSTMGISRADIEAWLTARSIRPIWSLDAGGQSFTDTQGVGPLIGWPDTVDTLLYPEGSFIHVDGGELDLGIIRDSTINLTNDLQIFGEIFETVAFVGVESYALTLDVCASGLAAGFVDMPDVCLSAS